MKTGKVSENVLKRSILKQISNKRDEVLMGAALGGDYAAIKLDKDEVFITTTCPVTGGKWLSGYLAVIKAVNGVAVAGAGAVAIMLSALLPEGTEESEIKDMMKKAEEACRKLNVQAIGGHTEISPCVNSAIINATAIGKIHEDRIISSAGAKINDDIVITKWIGMEGTALISYLKEDELKSHFSPLYIEEAKKCIDGLAILEEASIAAQMGASGMHDISKGGVFGALWEMGQCANAGMEVDLKAIPIRQESIEIAEHYGINPYELISGGSLIVTISNGHDYVRELKKHGINASVVGKITGTKDRVVINEDEKRFLTKPGADEIYRVIGWRFEH